MLWVRISDIAEEMRRKKVETELQNSGWVSADKMGGNSGPQPDLQFQPPPGQNFANAAGPGAAGARPPGAAAGPGAPQPQTSQIFIDDWFSLEPVGRVHLTMSFGMIFPYMSLFISLTTASETCQRQAGVRRWTWTKGCYSPTQRGSRRAVRPQVRPTTVLQHYALRALRRVPEIRCGNAVLGLQVHLPQEVLPQGGYEVYHTVKCRDGSGRGKAEPSYPTSLHQLLQHGRELVLPLRIHLAPWAQADPKVCRSV